MRDVVAKVAQAHLDDCYVPRCQLPLKVRGEWLYTDSILFPGYVMLATRDLPGLQRDLRILTEYNRLLSTDHGVVPLSNEELRVVEAVAGPEHYLAVSQGVIRGDALVVTGGPLKGKEPLIQRIDRHKRCAYLTAGVLGRARVRVGLEVPVRT